jgi:hypothetical protein
MAATCLRGRGLQPGDKAVLLIGAQTSDDSASGVSESGRCVRRGPTNNNCRPAVRARVMPMGQPEKWGTGYRVQGLSPNLENPGLTTSQNAGTTMKGKRRSVLCSAAIGRRKPLESLVSSHYHSIRSFSLTMIGMTVVSPLPHTSRVQFRSRASRFQISKRCSSAPQEQSRHQ